MGRNFVAGIASCYGVEGPEIESRMRARFSAPVHIDDGDHPASYAMDSESLSWGLMRSGRGVCHPPCLAPSLKKVYSNTSTPFWAFIFFSTVTFILPSRRHNASPLQRKTAENSLGKEYLFLVKFTWNA